jgi:hypothetical protein
MKKCKPNYRMNKFPGCGELKTILRYGSCRSCFINWTQETEEGSEWLKKQTAYRFKKNQSEKKKEDREKDREMRVHLMSTSKYWAKVFQPKFNDTIRVIDKGSGCIVSNSTLGKQAAGHYFSVGSNKSLSLNAHNVFLQSFQSNGWRGGEPIQYRNGIYRVFGENYGRFTDKLPQCPALNLTKIELIEYRVKLMKIYNEYKSEEYFQLSPLERIEMRNDLNSELGIYPEEFSIYYTNKIY